jgi:hypothetical protein
LLEGHRVKRRGRGRAAMSSSLDDGRNLPYFGRKGDKAPIELYATTEHGGSDGNCYGLGPNGVANRDKETRGRRRDVGIDGRELLTESGVELDHPWPSFVGWAFEALTSAERLEEAPTPMSP